LTVSRLTAALIAVFLGTNFALAHSFNATLIVPADTTVADDMRVAFLLAADERDGHPDNHSDGHLGGLDVYLTTASAGSGEPDIVADPASAAAMEDGNAAYLHLAASDLSALDTAAVLASAADPTVAPFAVRFREQTGREPGPKAEAAYLLARLIDLIVRPLDDAGDAAALRRELDRLR
jgi:hypothetical protein